YLEIGVQSGKSLALSRCKAIGVDPMPQVSAELFDQAQVLAMTSDDFFHGPAASLVKNPPDLVFIDGMHLFEYTLRDFMHVERLAAPWTLVVIDDIFPAHPAQAERRRRTRAWTGDVWKVFEILSQYRPDLFFLPVNTSPTGLLLISGLQPGNQILWDNYDTVIDKYSADMNPPKSILKRNGVLSSEHKAIPRILEAMKTGREKRLKSKTVTKHLKKELTDAYNGSRSRFPDSQMTDKVVVYTAISGCCDTLRDPEYVTPGVDYVCFTDNAHLHSEVWQIRPLPPFENDYVRQAKIPKILPHKFFPNHHVSLWVDSNIRLLGDLTPLITEAIEHRNMALFRHPEDRPSLEAEVQACIQMDKDDPLILSSQIEAYQQAGLPPDQSLPACMVILRRHQNPQIVVAMETWWEEIKNHSRRDQISLPYIVWKHGLKYETIDDNVRDNAFFKWYPHDMKIQSKGLIKSYEQAEVVFLSFPKAGRTWVRCFLATYLERQFGIPFNLEFPGTGNTPRIAFKHDHAQLYQDCPGEPRILHPDMLFGKRLVVMVRDPRDTAVSYYYQKEKREGFVFSGIDEFLLSDIYGIERQSRFVSALLDLYHKHPGPKVLLSYEQLRSNPIKHFSALLHFLLGEADQNALKEAVEETVFMRMQAKEIAIAKGKNGISYSGRLGLAGWDGDSNALNVRNGKVGGYRDEISLKTRQKIKDMPATSELLRKLSITDHNLSPTYTKIHNVAASEAVCIDGIRRVCVMLGPYRNLTSLMASLLFLHPHCQVLNHGGDRILNDSRLDFLSNPTRDVMKRFLRYAVKISGGGKRGNYGGSITLSHAFDNKYHMREAFTTAGGILVKRNIHALVWKETLKASLHLRTHVPDMDSLLQIHEDLVFLLPVRNPLDCAVSNIRTGHAALFPGLGGKQ
ncbi:MAG: DUF616 domain-containing protein, partial [Desulfobacteraceae bacterium]|nr:DUF616 domain-containing protein [Desulfobacteraceae bacterium]